MRNMSQHHKANKRFHSTPKSGASEAIRSANKKEETTMNRLVLRMTVCALILASGSLAMAGRPIPDDSLARPVLVTLDGQGAASGCYLNDGTNLYFLTAKHVLFNIPDMTLRSSKATLLSYPGDPKDQGLFKIELNLQELNAQSQVRPHATHDVVLVRLGTFNKDGQIGFSAPVKLLQKADGPLPSGSTTGIKTFNDVLTANDIYLFGYPGSIGIEQMPQLDYNRPLLRRGIIAGKNETKKTIIVDSFVYPGNSGGPVVEVEHTSLTETKFLLIGIVSEFVPFKEEWINKTHRYTNMEISNSGYCIVEPMDSVLELLWK